MANKRRNYAPKRIFSPMGRGSNFNPEALVTSEEREVYRLHHATPGLSQEEIAKKLGKNQGQISRILRSARRKINTLKGLCEAAGGDPSVVNRFLDS